MTIKLLVVDDSALMRRLLVQLFQARAGFEVRTARNGREAVEENLAWQPDVITLDVNMPELDGLSALAQIMASRPVPVVMLSSLTEQGALATFEALALGAVDFMAKPEGTISLSIDAIGAVLIDKVKAAARAKLRRPRGPQTRADHTGPELTSSLKPKPKAAGARRAAQANTELQGLVIIGVSTGGPSTLEAILPRLPADYPYPVIVVQHMPAAFTGPFAQRMDRLCHLSVIEVNRPLPVEPGMIYIAKGGADCVVTVRGRGLSVLARPESPDYLWHPSVELLARSVLEHCEPSRVIGVMLTGMGHDGAQAFAEIKQRGGRTIAESEETAVVYGMPRELVERNGASLVLPVHDIADQLIAWSH